MTITGARWWLHSPKEFRRHKGGVSAPDRPTKHPHRTRISRNEEPSLVTACDVEVWEGIVIGVCGNVV